MTTQDIEKLKALCEKEGFEVITESPYDNDKFFVVRLMKDPWDGVEFVQSNWSKTIYPVNQIGNFKPCNDEYTPSTESAYVEQLKATAHELFGEIKDGMEFDRKELFPKVFLNPDQVQRSELGWSYQKDCDQLYFGNLGIYKQGKWAKRVEEPIRATIKLYDFSRSNDMRLIFWINKERSKSFDWDNEELKNHIEESIEAFLNRKP